MDSKKLKVNMFDFCLLLTAVFAILKAFGFIMISWFWVFSPIIFAVVVNLLFTIMLLFACMVAFIIRHSKNFEDEN